LHDASICVVEGEGDEAEVDFDWDYREGMMLILLSIKY